MRVLGRRRALLTAGTQPTGPVTDSSTGLPTELSLRHSEILLLLSEARDGLSADELALALSEQEISPVTVRAEMSRLRTALDAVTSGPLPMTSRPYRLLRGVRTDLVDLRAVLRSGRLRAAVAQYPGPVLPRSEAPGVVELRSTLHHELRRALLDRRDPDALLSFADTDHGHDDLAVWSAALASLPPSSPRRPQVLSHCQDLSRALR